MDEILACCVLQDFPFFKCMASCKGCEELGLNIDLCGFVKGVDTWAPLKVKSWGMVNW